MPPNPPQGHRYVPREESPLEAVRRERDALLEEVRGQRRAMGTALANIDKNARGNKTVIMILDAALRGEYPP
jgi:hypothetical protein